jgi:integrase
VLAEAEISDRRSAPGNPASLGGNLTLFLLMFLGCGLRRKEAMAAKLENIDWQSRSLRLLVTKNDEEREVGLGERLYSLLLPRKGKTGYILPRFYPNSVSRAISRHFKRCGFQMRLHDARHTYTTRLLDLGVLRHNAMGRTGHKDSRMLDHYTHPIFGEVYEDQFPFMRQPEAAAAEAPPQPAENGKSHLRVVK